MMPREISADTDKACLKGEILTIVEIKKRFSLAMTINNTEIMEILFKADHPVTIREIKERMKTETKMAALGAKMRKLFKEKLVVRFYLSGRRFGYLLSEKGLHNYKTAKNIDKT